MLTASRTLERLVEQLRVEAVAAMDRTGVFAEHGYRRPDSAIATLLTVDRPRAQEITRAAEQVCTRIDLQGETLPPGCRPPRPRSPPGRCRCATSAWSPS